MTNNQTTYVRTDIGMFASFMLRLWFYMFVGAIALAFVFTVIILFWKVLVVAALALLVLFIILGSRKR